MSLQKKENDLIARPADIAQITILMDQSSSMDHVAREARMAIGSVLEEFKAKEGMVLAVKTFNTRLKTVSNFGAPPPQIFHYNPDGGTHLYAAVRDVIKASKAEAELTPDLKTHHVLVVITDGHDESFDELAKAAAQQEIDNIGAGGAATFLLLDFSFDGTAGAELGLKGIKIDHNPDAFRDAMKQVAKAIAQIADNVVKQLPPTSGLCLPPAR